jgi:hypothetical protein
VVIAQRCAFYHFPLDSIICCEWGNPQEYDRERYMLWGRTGGEKKCKKECSNVCRKKKTDERTKIAHSSKNTLFVKKTGRAQIKKENKENKENKMVTYR